MLDGWEMQQFPLGPQSLVKFPHWVNYDAICCCSPNLFSLVQPWFIFWMILSSRGIYAPPYVSSGETTTFTWKRKNWTMSGMSLRRVGAFSFGFFPKAYVQLNIKLYYGENLWKEVGYISSRGMLWKVPPAGTSRSYSSPEHGHELVSTRNLRRWPSCAFSILLTAFNQPSNRISPPPWWSLKFTHAWGRHKTITVVAADILH